MLKNLKIRALVAACCIVSMAFGSGLAQAAPIGGPKVSNERVLAYDTDSYNVDLRANEKTTITLIGDGDTDLDVFVYDQWGNQVASSTDSSDVCRIVFEPNVGGNYRIEVKNLGDVYNAYQLMIR